MFECSAEERALQAEREIMELVDKGELKLERGIYLQRDYNNGCNACALGSAARAICAVEPQTRTPSGMRRALKEKGCMTITESMLMEQGFEDWERDDDKEVAKLALFYGEPVPAGGEDNPFYRLGQRLAARLGGAR